ncbi:response regulator transcription factor [Phreatobacter aquaticus]|uniref:Response regulator transcription factor n=2 Tax=Phreatobacter aquaticus TaxID=2570229 RepID=A0A4D7QF96_9HYPH|nr:response regulator transcription factor [Phreatobacter aquaticus]
MEDVPMTTQPVAVRESLTFAVQHPFPIVAETIAALVRANHGGATSVDLDKADLVIATASRLETLDLAPGTRVAVLIDHADRRPVQEARSRGAIAALPLDLPADHLRAALGAVLAGRTWWPVVIAIDPEGEAPASRRLDALSGQQFKVLDLMSRGRLNKQIAYDLGISEGTVKSHVSSILRKLGVERRTQAIATFITSNDVARPARPIGGVAHLSRATHAAR